MFFTYVRRELLNRKKQTFIIAIGMALAIALVVLLSAISTGVAASQKQALSAVYGVGTDLTVTKPVTQAASSSGTQFKFGAGAGTTSGTSKKLSQSTLTVSRTANAFTTSMLNKVQATSGVDAATGILLLESNNFSGTIPSGTGANAQSGATGTRPSAPTSGSSTGTASGPSNFSFSNTTVAGISAGTAVGPMSSVTLKSGRLLKASDTTYEAVLDSDYATSQSKKVGSTLTVGGKKFTVVGIVASSSSSSTDTAADVYIPLKVAQKLSGETGKITSIYVKADSASSINTLDASLVKTLGKTYTVNTQADLASTVTGAVANASSLLNSFGLWIVLAALAAAFLLAILFTSSGVARRTREFGTLKALGFSNGRIMRQVTGESIITSIFGGIFGSIIGVAGILILDALQLQIKSAATTGGQGVGPGGGPGQQAASAASTSAITIAPVFTPEVLGYALGIALIGGMLAGAFASWRAARLRPAVALRSI